MASKRPTVLLAHGDERVDDWYWLRDKDDSEVLELLEAENLHTARRTASLASLKENVYAEFVSRIQETDLSVPVRKGSWRYYHRTEEGKQYAIHCRTLGTDASDDDAEVVLLDENKEAEGSEFFALGAFDVSPDGNRLAFSVDTDGDEVFTMRVRDLSNGTLLEDEIERTHYGSAWSRDGSILFYTRPDETMRPYQVWRHRIGTNPSSDELMFQEEDQRFFVSVGNSKTDDFVVVTSASSLTTEIRMLRSDDPLGEFEIVEQRRPGVEYHVWHHRSGEGDTFFISTNEDAPNFKLMMTISVETGRDHWTEVVEHRNDVKLEDVEVFSEHLVLSERADATARLSVLNLKTGERSVLGQPESIYTTGTTGNAEFDTQELRFEYTSFVTPRTIYEVDLTTDERTLLKQQPVLGDFDPSLYISERLWAVTPDGTRIPLSLVHRRDRPRAGGPALLYGYGSYEISMDPTFSSLRLSLLDRGFVFAIAHVRGGGDMGRLWYEHGKFLEKKNTFGDFITCAEHLIEEGYTSAPRLAARGGSAGGLLMGAVANARPDLFGAIVAEVPFVDVLTTMLDTSLPLTVHEFEEWGNPAEENFYRYIKSYSPYDNVEAKEYPAMLVTSGINDPRVGYWEAAKWVQKLRDLKTDANDILLKTEMNAGHMGPSGRYDAWKDEAFIYAVLLRALGVAE